MKSCVKINVSYKNDKAIIPINEWVSLLLFVNQCIEIWEETDEDLAKGSNRSSGGRLRRS